MCTTSVLLKPRLSRFNRSVSSHRHAQAALVYGDPRIDYGTPNDHLK